MKRRWPVRPVITITALTSALEPEGISYGTRLRVALKESQPSTVVYLTCGGEEFVTRYVRRDRKICFQDATGAYREEHEDNVHIFGPVLEIIEKKEKWFSGILLAS